MKLVTATYHHNTIGFPGVVLKFTAIDGAPIDSAYVVINGIIDRNWEFRYHNQSAEDIIANKELERFDKWVRSNFTDKPEMQG